MEARKPDKLSVEEPKIRIGPPVGLEEDPHSPKNSPAQIPPSNYQSKVADPTGAGGKEAEVAPLISQFDNLKFHHDSPSKSQLEQKSEQTPIKNPLGTQENPESNPETQDPAQDTLAGKISSATSAVATTAISAKNAVASKLGYGGGPQEQGDQEYSSNRSASEVASECAGKVYEKVAGAGGAVMSKVGGGGGGEMTAKGYLAEKFRPGDEDKALSEVITDAFHRKEAAATATATAVEKPGGKVMESEEVAARLGTAAGKKREGEDALAAGAESSGEGVVERVKDAFGSWLGKSAGVQTAAQDSIGGSYGATHSTGRPCSMSTPVLHPHLKSISFGP
ncbi:hypothetical protein DH2020_044475 [Rehmannia glutinosa]|uniref:Low-temperature-induced 65 kDa protein n=1 Tax=Rehmannia glutinosa TaxID=99300 RepID=A0ABR0UHY9_REHGL